MRKRSHPGVDPFRVHSPINRTVFRAPPIVDRRDRLVLGKPRKGSAPEARPVLAQQFDRCDRRPSMQVVAGIVL